MNYIIYLGTIKAVFLDEGPAATALVMVVNGLRVTTEYIYESVCKHNRVSPIASSTPIWSVVINGSLSL